MTDGVVAGRVGDEVYLVPGVETCPDIAACLTALVFSVTILFECTHLLNRFKQNV